MQPETIEELMNLFVKGEQVYVEGNTTPYDICHDAQKNEEINGHGVITRIKKMREDNFDLHLEASNSLCLPTTDAVKGVVKRMEEEYDWYEEDLNYWRKLSAEGLTYAVCMSEFHTRVYDEGETVQFWKETDWILFRLKE